MPEISGIIIIMARNRYRYKEYGQGIERSKLLVDINHHEIMLEARKRQRAADRKLFNSLISLNLLSRRTAVLDPTRRTVVTSEGEVPLKRFEFLLNVKFKPQQR